MQVALVIGPVGTENLGRQFGAFGGQVCGRMASPPEIVADEEAQKERYEKQGAGEAEIVSGVAHVWQLILVHPG